MSYSVFCSKVRAVTRLNPSCGRRFCKAFTSVTANLSSISAACMEGSIRREMTPGTIGWKICSVEKRNNYRARTDSCGAAELLRNGGTVAFPTETVYGLGANALDPAAVAKIFEAKERPSWDPVIVHICDRNMLDRVAVLSPAIAVKAEALMTAFWPGPLTLLLPRTDAVPDSVTAGRPLVGVRIPAHPPPPLS